MKPHIKSLLLLLPIILAVAYLLKSVSNRSEFSDSDLVQRSEAMKAFETWDLKTIQDWTGKDIKVDTLKEPIVIMHYWASWCAPCIHEFPDLIEMAKKMKGKVQVFAISEDTDVKEIEAFIKSFKEAQMIPYFHLIWDKDHKYMDRWSVTKLPESFIYGPDRKLVKNVSGVVSWTSPDTDEFFRLVEKREIKP